jgi:hypothetical protein
VTRKDIFVDVALPLYRPTCELVEALLHSFQVDSDECLIGQALQEEYACELVGTESPAGPDMGSGLLSSNRPTSAPLIPSIFTLCATTNKSCRSARQRHLVSISLSPQGGFLHNASTYLEADFILTNTLNTGAAKYAVGRNLAGVCGCPPVPNHCQLCRSQSLPHPEHFILRFEEFKIPFAPMTCSDFEFVMTQVSASNVGCLQVRFFKLSLQL